MQAQGMVHRLVVLVFLCGLTAPRGEQLGLSLDLYHAVSTATAGSLWENINPAGIMGVLKYIHTEVIAEHEVSPPNRQRRKNGLEVIERATVSVKNPSTMPDNLIHLVDFGPYMHFEAGRTADAHGLSGLANHGEFVGVQMQTDVRYPTKQPYYWFSLAGHCPNLARGDKSGAECLKYANDSGHSGPVLGGLCAGGAGNASLKPTGTPGCTYSYGEVTNVSLDQLVGITKEDCGGRLCKDWVDFRQFCTNSAYRWMFDANGNNVSAGFCVEYDIHPKCASDCSSEACQSLPEHLREAGLPFWRGRCKPEANQERAEALAEAFGIRGATTAHKLVSATIRQQPQTCVHEVPGICAPAPGQGGMYCTRDWAGVCQPCYIPGTQQLWPATHMPVCPYNILQTLDYKHRFPPPDCLSTSASDRCCLYTGGCALKEVDPLLLPLTDDGLAVAASLQDTTALVAYFVRLRGVHPRELEAFAYHMWGDSPQEVRTLNSVKSEMLALGLLSNATITTTTTTTVTSTTLGSTNTLSIATGTHTASEQAAALTSSLVGVTAATTTQRLTTSPHLPELAEGGEHHDMLLANDTQGQEQAPVLAPVSVAKSIWWMWVVLGAVCATTLLGLVVLVHVRRSRGRKAERGQRQTDPAGQTTQEGQHV